VISVPDAEALEFPGSDALEPHPATSSRPAIPTAVRLTRRSTVRPFAFETTS